MGKPLTQSFEIVSKRPKRLPVVLSRAEVEAVFVHLEGVPRLVASLLYGSGLRQVEALRLRVKDLDFDYCQLTVREGTFTELGMKIIDETESLSDVLHRNIPPGGKFTASPANLDQKD